MRDLARRWSTMCLAAVVASALAACNGGAGGGAAAPNLMPSVAQQMGASDLRSNAISPVSIYPGEVVGTDNRFSPKDGDSSTGGKGQKVGAITCDKTEHVDNYHVHFYVGVVVNGKQIAVPDAIGIVKPGPEDNGYIKTALDCWYWIHTHDASGMMHIEDPRDLPPSDVVFKFSAAMSVWGQTYSATNFGKFKGTVHAFVGNVPLGTTTVSKYAAWTKSVGAIPLHSHTVIWIEVGTPYYTAAQLPSVTFYTEY